MYICKQCLDAIRSRGENPFVRKINLLDIDESLVHEDDVGEYMVCEWCNEKINVEEMREVQ